MRAGQVVQRCLGEALDWMHALHRNVLMVAIDALVVELHAKVSHLEG